MTVALLTMARAAHAQGEPPPEEYNPCTHWELSNPPRQDKNAKLAANDQLRDPHEDIDWRYYYAICAKPSKAPGTLQFITLRVAVDKTGKSPVERVHGSQVESRTPVVVYVQVESGKPLPAISLLGNDGISSRIYDPNTKGDTGKPSDSSSGAGSNVGSIWVDKNHTWARQDFGPQLGPTVSLTVKTTVDPDRVAPKSPPPDTMPSPPSPKKEDASTECIPKLRCNKPEDGTPTECVPRLVCTARAKPAPAPSEPESRTLTRTYEIETLYRTALRLGIAGMWSPWVGRVAVRSTTGGGKYVESMGQGDGGLELIGGYSVFLATRRNGTGGMSNLSPNCGLAANASIGILKAGLDGLTGFSSVRAGLEWVYGLDFALGINFGANRHDTPNDGFQVGKPLPVGATTIETRFSVTPGFGVYANFTPGLIKLLGLAAGG